MQVELVMDLDGFLVMVFRFVAWDAVSLYLIVCLGLMTG